MSATVLQPSSLRQLIQRRTEAIGPCASRRLDEATSPAGEFLLTVFAGLAQLERRMISQRTKSALAAKKTRGEKLGRPVALTPSQIRAAQKMFAEGEGASQGARLFKVDRATLYRALKKVA